MFFVNDTATTKIYTPFPTRRSSDRRSNSTPASDSVHLIELRSLAGDPDCVHRVLEQVPTDSEISFLVTCEDRRKSLEVFRDEVQAISERNVVIAKSGEPVASNVVYVVHEGKIGRAHV